MANEESAGLFIGLRKTASIDRRSAPVVVLYGAKGAFGEKARLKKARQESHSKTNIRFAYRAPDRKAADEKSINR